MALKKYSTPSTFYAFAASCNACRMRRKRLIRPTVLTLPRPDKTRQRRIRQDCINSAYSPLPRHLSQNLLDSPANLSGLFFEASSQPEYGSTLHWRGWRRINPITGTAQLTDNLIHFQQLPHPVAQHRLYPFGAAFSSTTGFGSGFGAGGASTFGLGGSTGLRLRGVGKVPVQTRCYWLRWSDRATVLRHRLPAPLPLRLPAAASATRVAAGIISGSSRSPASAPAG